MSHYTRSILFQCSFPGFELNWLTEPKACPISGLVPFTVKMRLLNKLGISDYQYSQLYLQVNMSLAPVVSILFCSPVFCTSATNLQDISFHVVTFSYLFCLCDLNTEAVMAFIHIFHTKSLLQFFFLYAKHFHFVQSQQHIFHIQ